MDEQLAYQRSVLLARLAADKKQTLTGAALAKLPKAVREGLGLDAARAAEVLAGLAGDNYVTEKRSGKRVSWQLNEAGAAYARTLPAWPPPPRVEPAHDDAQLLARQKAFALFQLFIAKGQKLAAAQLKTKLTTAKAKPVAFNPPTIIWVAWLLSGDGSVREHRRGKSASYELTPEGTARLAAAEQHPEVELTLSGAALTVLTTAARAGAEPAQPPGAEPAQPPGREAAGRSEPQPVPAPPATPGDGPMPPPGGLTGIILAGFRELLRERYSHTGLVPIHEVRQWVAGRHGEPTARHEALDPPIRQLRREGRLRLVSIADQSRATSEQLGQSIPGENEIFFYLSEPL